VLVADPQPARGLVLMLHGGQQRSHEPVHAGRLSYRRMVPFGGALRRAGRRDGLAVWLLRYRYRGWNEPDRDPVGDARWALQRVRESHPAVRVVLLGHSMGARVGLYVADDPAVVAVCALAPWIEPGDPVAQLRGKSLLIAHGDLERVTSPAVSFEYALDARQVSDRVCRFDVHGDGHAMLRRARDWTRVVRRFVLAELGMRPMDERIAAAMAAPAERGLRVPL
jgi:alpha-beta hydrolase superfamily lysophospholipase